MRFEGKVALVTGAAGGIGRATARRLASEGARVLVNDVNAAGIDEVVAELGERGIPGLADVTSEADVQALVDRTGPIHILVNNAGGGLPGAAWAGARDSTLADWEGFLALNLTSAFLCSRAVLPGMLAAGRGHIVSVGSISGSYGQRAGVGYAAAKAGLEALVASIAKDHATEGISSNGIVVGNAPFPTRPAERQAQLDSYVHLARVGRHDEFAAAIAFLCSEESSYLSGAMVPVDGGFHRFNLL